MKDIFALLAAAIALIGYIPYLRGVRAGYVEPHPYTWLVSAIVSGVILFGQIIRGAGVGALPTAASEIFTLIIFVYSLKYGLRHVTKFDGLFLLAALFSIVPWLLTQDPTDSVVMAVAIDVVAFVPTIRKTWKHPKSESAALYGANIARHALTLLSLASFNFVTALHSLVMLAMNTGMSAMILVRGNHASTTSDTIVS